ncbi:hypothetical protein NliqN6_1451 [Naganishia liquefaciens]|uniref:RING-type E3 ubiquitin transferase n=1 Tax=Naganishia liquefaciens TaxID=104408 RepID=A0A8H3TQD4_9TREE|nr:hypothetical protein NliqN6_1451 [Naganishia liquefaciens]
MSDEIPDAERMRAKRIAAMQRAMAQSASQDDQSSSQALSSAHPSTQSRPESALNRLTAATASPASGPSVSKSPVPQVKPTPVVNAPQASSARASPVPVARTATTTAVKKVPYLEWECDKIGEILDVSLSHDNATRSNPPRIYLSSLAEELTASAPDTIPTTSPSQIDTLLIARLSLDPSQAGNSTTFEYLAACWTRLYAAQREYGKVSAAQGWKEQEGQQWKATWEAVRELVVSYVGYTLEDPGMFPQPEGRPAGPAEFLPILLSATSNNPIYDPLTSSTSAAQPSVPLPPSSLPQFLTDLSARFTSDPAALSPILESILSHLFQSFFQVQPPVDLVGGEWRKWIGALEVLVSVKGIAQLVPSLAVFFLASAAPEQVEWFSLLGPLTRLSVFPREWPSVWKTYFSKPDERTKADIEANQAGLRASLAQLQDELFKVYNALIRASPTSREGLLDYIGVALQRNVKRSGMRVDPKTVASDGFMVNLQAILLRLFEPVLDVTYSKLDRIDGGYYERKGSKVDVREETKIKATQAEYDEYRAQVEHGSDAGKTTSPFISDLFFLLNAYQHVGMNKTISNRERASKNVYEIKKDLRRLEAQRASWGSGTPQALQGEAAIQRFKGEIDILRASVAAYDTQLLSKELIQRNVAFLCFSMTWLIRLVDPTHRYPVTMISLPLPAEAPREFKMLPEYLIENVAEYLEFIIRWAPPDTLDKTDKDTIVTFILTFLSPNYVNNPFLKAKFMGILAAGVQPTGYFRRGILYETLIYHPLASHYLMPTLVRFFIDVEITGASTQFYDKFNIRRDIDAIFKAMWDNPLQRDAFTQARKDDFELFIRFVNLLMSDTTYHLDESLSKLATIHSVQQAMANQEEWNAKSEEERKDLESQLQQAESSAPFHTHQGRSHVQLIKEFTATTKEPFLTPEIVDRLAATLDENVVTLVGPKMQDLKVAEPEKFAFKPKDLLADITQIYINLGQSPEFIRAVANDGRSYSKATFEKLARILKNRGILIDREIESLLTFIAKVEEAKATIEIEDEREIPDEFVDPLMATLMKDPVILPVSRVTIDRSTIRAVLLQKPFDPFSNQPLKLEDCIPDIELKQKIDAWIAEGHSQGMKGSLAEDTPMEVDEL